MALSSIRLSLMRPSIYKQPPKIACSRESFMELESFINATVPFIDGIVDHAELEASAYSMLERVFPEWNIPDEVEMVQCKDGITNKCIFHVHGDISLMIYFVFVVLKCKNVKTGMTVLLRAYGKKSELIIDRPQEMVVRIWPYLKKFTLCI